GRAARRHRPRRTRLPAQRPRHGGELAAPAARGPHSHRSRASGLARGDRQTTDLRDPNHPPKEADVSVTETVLERNIELSGELSERHLTLTPDLKVLVLTCADHRVDPAHVLGLDLGEAVVLRNPGGRVNPAFIQSLGVLRGVANVEGLEPAFELIVMHHT